MPLNTSGFYDVNTGTTPDEVALKFKFPFPVKIKGWYGRITPAAGGDFQAILYDSDGTTALQTISYDGDIRLSNATGNYIDYFSSSQAILKDTFYRLAVKPTTTTTITLGGNTHTAAAILDALPGGQNLHESTRTDAGAWTDTTTDRPQIGLIIDSADDAVGGSAATTAYTFA